MTYRDSVESGLVERISYQLDPDLLVVVEIQQRCDALKLGVQLGLARLEQPIVVSQLGVDSVQGQGYGPDAIIDVAVKLVLFNGDIHLTGAPSVLVRILVRHLRMCPRFWEHSGWMGH